MMFIPNLVSVACLSENGPMSHEFNLSLDRSDGVSFRVPELRGLVRTGSDLHVSNRQLCISSTSPSQGNLPIATADFNCNGIPDAAILGLTSAGQVLSIFVSRPDGSDPETANLVAGPDMHRASV